MNTTKDPNVYTKGDHHYRYGHVLELFGEFWICLICSHPFETPELADRFWCGDDCTDICKERE